MSRAIPAGLCVLLLSAGASAVRAEPAREAAVQKPLSRLSQLRVFFGHQSVGMNLLDGVREVASRHPEIPLRVSEVSGELPAGTFGHAFVAENGKPELKLEGFERALSSGIGAVADVALLKFCYADFSRDTDPAALFARYQATLRALRPRYPRLTFVHVTVPLTTVDTGAKSAVKRLLGRAPGGLLENARREEFNELLRGAFAGKEPLFDLALLESTAPTGAREQHGWKGRMIPALLPAYTEDGGHLASNARSRMAEELIAVLASASPAPHE
jgi:hypothetical protein